MSKRVTRYNLTFSYLFIVSRPSLVSNVESNVLDMTNLRCEIEKELSMVAQRAGSEEVTNGRGDNTLINWNPSLEDKFVIKTRDQPEPGSFFPRSLWGGRRKTLGTRLDPGYSIV